jgi:hypothetical protein
MHIKSGSHLTTATAIIALLTSANLATGQNAALRRLLDADTAEQAAWINSHLRDGMPPSDEFAVLVRAKSGVALPLIEQKIEEVLRPPLPPIISPTNLQIRKSSSTSRRPRSGKSAMASPSGN